MTLSGVGPDLQDVVLEAQLHLLQAAHIYAGVFLHVFEGPLILPQHKRPPVDVDHRFLTHVVPDCTHLHITLLMVLYSNACNTGVMTFLAADKLGECMSWRALGE